MAVVSTTRELIGIFKGISDLGIFGGGGGKDRRRRKREALQRVGFNLVENGPDWNIDDYYDTALDNLATLYEQYGDIAIQLHNNRKLNDTIASNYSTLEQMAIAEQENQSAFFGNNLNSQEAINAGTGVLTALAIAGGLLWYVGRG